jgi:hypothetical protein
VGCLSLFSEKGGRGDLGLGWGWGGPVEIGAVSLWDCCIKIGGILFVARAARG